MKKKILLTISIIFVVLMVCSCETTVAIRTMIPAEVNISGFEKVGVVSTDDSDDIYWSRSRQHRLESNLTDHYINAISYELATNRANLTSKLANYATNIVTLAVKNGASDYADSYVTDNIIRRARKNGTTVKSNLEENGIDAVITSEISIPSLVEYLDVRPYYLKDENDKTVECYRLYLIRKASLSLSYTVTDVINNTIVKTDTISDSASEELYLGHREGDAAFYPGRDFYSTKTGYDLLVSVLDKIGKKLSSAISQSYTTSFFFLEESQNPQIMLGVDYADAELYEQALDIFLSEWNTTKSFESGYNAAIMYFAIGDYGNAENMALLVWTSSLDVKAKRLYEKFSVLAANDIKAKSQLTSSSDSSENELVGF